jgi:DNA invertase Pin-like site-specific DNA recombinase
MIVFAEAGFILQNKFSSKLADGYVELDFDPRMNENKIQELLSLKEKFIVIQQASILSTSISVLKQIFSRLIEQNNEIFLCVENRYVDQHYVSAIHILSDLEQQFLSVRIRRGQRQSARYGRFVGRPTAINDSLRVATKLLHSKHVPIKQIARELKIGIGSIYKILGDDRCA